MSDAAFETLKRLPAYRVAEQAIRSRILDGTLSPGTMLPPEHDLAQQLGVTRPTVREALRSLESAGLIGRGPRRRMVVTAPAKHVVTTAMHEAIVLHGISYRELWEVGAALEPLAARLAANNVTPDILDALHTNLEHTARSLNDPLALSQADLEFHELITQASNNQALLLAREPLSSMLFAAYATVLRETGPGARRVGPNNQPIEGHKRLLEAHIKIVAALEAGDPQTAEQWMSKHFVDFRRGWELAGLDLDAPVTPDSISLPH